MEILTLPLLLGWLPTTLQIVCLGAFAIFIVVSILHLIAFILDIIPFL